VLALVCGAGLALWQASIANAERAHANAVKNFLVSMLEEADPYRLSQKPEPVTELLERASRQISTQFPDRPQVQAELLTVLGTTLIDRHDLKRGEALLTEAVRLGIASNGPRHPLTLQARAFLSLAHRFSWPIAKRRAELNSLLADYAGVSSAAPLHYFIALESDWNLLQAEGQNSKLIGLARKILALPGLPKAKQIEAQWLLIQSLRKNPGSGEDLATVARSAFAATLAFHQQNARHPAVIEAREELGRTLAAQSVTREALAELARAATDAELVFGENSPAPVFFSFNLARYQWQAGLLADALASLEHAEACLRRQSKDLGGMQHEILELRAKILFGLRRYQDIPVATSADIGRLAAIRLGQNLDVLLIQSLSLRNLAVAEQALRANRPLIAAEQARLASTTAPIGPLGLTWRSEAALLLARAGTNASPCSSLKPAIGELQKTLLQPTPLLKELITLATASSCPN
jgi:DnaJ-domain-containing protein 1